MKLLYSSLLGVLLWFLVIVLSNRLHVKHYRYLLRISKRAGTSKESVASLRAGQVAGAAVVLPLMVVLVLLERELTVAQHNGVVIVGLTLGMVLTYACIQGSRRVKRPNKARRLDN
jgi:hypothetical protein